VEALLIVTAALLFYNAAAVAWCTAIAMNVKGENR
jgi:hypothetical protein